MPPVIQASGPPGSSRSPRSGRSCPASCASAPEDPNLGYLDGRDLYREADYAELPLPDELHPDTASHHRIGTRFAELAFGASGLFSANTA